MSFGYDPELPGGFQADDFAQRELEAEGNHIARQLKKAKRLFDSGDLRGAAAACPHTAGYTLPCEGDPARCSGFRCTHCGSLLSAGPWDEDDSHVVNPCEFEPFKDGAA